LPDLRAARASTAPLGTAASNRALLAVPSALLAVASRGKPRRNDRRGSGLAARRKRAAKPPSVKAP